MIYSNLYWKYGRELKFSLQTWEMAHLVILKAVLSPLGKMPYGRRGPHMRPMDSLGNRPSLSVDLLESLKKGLPIR